MAVGAEVIEDDDEANVGVDVDGAPVVDVDVVGVVVKGVADVSSHELGDLYYHQS